MPSDDGFLRELRATFRVEAQEHLQTMSQGFIDLEAATQPAARAPIVETVFRAAHSLKGASRAVDLPDVESVCQLLEDVLAVQRRGQGELPIDALDVLYRALDVIGALVADIDGTGPPAKPAEVGAVRRELRRIAAAVPAGKGGGGAAGTAPSVEQAGDGVEQAPAPVAADVPPMPMPMPPAPLPVPVPVLQADNTVRVPLAKLEAQLLRTEELLGVRLSVGQRVAQLQQLAPWFDTWRRTAAGLESDVRMLRQRQASLGGGEGDGAVAGSLSRMLEFWAWGEEAIRLLESNLADIGRLARQDHELLQRGVDAALGSAKQLLLLPFAVICAPFPKLVRDLCRAEGKEADLVIQGEQVALDKHILEELKDPLMHMLRNAVDHAVEAPAERAVRGKPRRATLVLAVEQIDRNQVRITLSDDGAGIDPERVRAAAVRNGLLSAEEAALLDDAAARMLVFRSALTTGQAVTPLSGRGLGLAIVQENARRLGGDVQVDSTRGEGTVFRIVVPAVRATFRGILCEVAQRRFLMPASAVEHVERVKPDARCSVEGREAVRMDGRVLALVHLADVLELPAEPVPKEAALQVIVVGGSGPAVAFAVDAVLEEREVLVKPLRRPLIRVRNISAAAVLGTGELVPVLNAADLLQAARHVAVGSRPSAAPARPRRAKHILVAEDSITSRLLLKSVLQAAGYDVKTAVDGMEALSLLRAERFDLLVSDVEMPRLNGFDLTARLRVDRKLSELPVVLVTALATPEDRARGVDAGADAYITKGSFDQDHLLEAIERLI